MLNSVVTHHKNKLKNTLRQGKQLKSNIKRLPLVFELLSNTVSPTVDLSPILKEQLYIIEPSITRIGIARCKQNYINSYKPGTVHERSYIKAISSLYKDDYIELLTNLTDKVMLQET